MIITIINIYIYTEGANIQEMSSLHRKNSFNLSYQGSRGKQEVNITAVSDVHRSRFRRTLKSVRPNTNFFTN